MNQAYWQLKTAQSLFGLPPQSLNAEQRERVRQLALRQTELERQVLNSDEARFVTIPDEALETAWHEIQRRYPSTEAFMADLAGQGMDSSDYAMALERELRVAAIMEQVGTTASEVSDADIEHHYQHHRAQYQRPEVRRARHILITINNDLPDHAQGSALAAIQAIAQQLRGAPEHFAQLALKHSECPTALCGGILGEVRRGQLFISLETRLFSLESGQISEPTESPLGFHLLYCEHIAPAHALPLAQVRTHIRRLLEQRARSHVQTIWLKQLSA